MAQIPELADIGVEVEQVYQTPAPTIVVPTLVPCIIGACHEIHELLDEEGALNSDILVVGPAIATAPLNETNYLACSGKTLIVRVNGGPEQTFTMPTTATLTAAQIAAAINGATVAPVGFAAYVYTTPAAAKHLQLRTTGTGGGSTLQIVGGTLVTPGANQLGYGTGYTYYGLGAYVQDGVLLKQESFPDPRGNLDELNIDESSIRVFVDLTTETRELLSSESYLRGGSYYTAGPPIKYGVLAHDDGDGDLLTPFVNLLQAGAVVPNLLHVPSAAQVASVGVNYLAARLEVHGKTLIMQVDGSGKQTTTFVGDPVVSLDSAGWTFFPAHTSTLKFTLDGQLITVVFNAADLLAVISAVNVASQAALGIDVAFQSDANGNYDIAGAYLGLVYGGSPTAAEAASAQHSVIVTEDSGVHANEMFGSVEPAVPGGTEVQLLQPNGAGPRDAPWAQINNIWGSLASLNVGDLNIDSTDSGYESKIEIDSNSTALTALGLTAGSYYGTPFVTRVGDYLYGDGTLVGMITEVHAGSTQGRLKLDREIALTYTATAWYIISKNLDTVSSAQYGVSVPTPDLLIDTNGDAWIKHDFLRDTTGTAVGTAAVNMYCMYNALRLDVSPAADSPALLSFDDTDALEAALGPITPDNPLAYGLYVALQTAPGMRVYGVGLDETSADAPYGTDDAFSSAFDFLESREVYGLAPMTDEASVATLLNTHVLAMSATAEKMERIGVFYLGLPTRKVDTILVSGTDGDTVSGPKLDTKIANLTSALLAAGIDPTDVTVADGVFVDIGTDAKNWNVKGAVTSGTQLPINTTFAAGENDDAFYSTTSFPVVVSDTFSVKIRGAAVASLDDEVATVYYRGKSYNTRRMWMIQCNALRASVDGVDSLVAGFYGCAAKVAQVAGLNPALPLSRRPMGVFTGVTGTSDRYKPSQLRQMAAGGADLLIAESDSGPVFSRRQVTTDTTTIEAREQSIVKAVDFVSKFLRVGITAYVGMDNITQTYLDSLSTVTSALCRWLIEVGKVVGNIQVSSLLQDADEPDAIVATVPVDVLYPANKVKLTLII